MASEHVSADVEMKGEAVGMTVSCQRGNLNLDRARLPSLSAISQHQDATSILEDTCSTSGMWREKGKMSILSEGRV